MPAAPTQGSGPPSNTPIRPPAAKGRYVSAGVPLTDWLPLAREVRLVGPGRATRSWRGRAGPPRARTAVTGDPPGRAAVTGGFPTSRIAHGPPPDGTRLPLHTPLSASSNHSGTQDRRDGRPDADRTRPSPDGPGLAAGVAEGAGNPILWRFCVQVLGRRPSVRRRWFVPPSPFATHPGDTPYGNDRVSRPQQADQVAKAGILLTDAHRT
jgi:hypothetical protein